MATIRESAVFDVVVVDDEGGAGGAVECVDEHAPTAIAPIAATPRIEAFRSRVRRPRIKAETLPTVVISQGSARNAGEPPWVASRDAPRIH